MTVIAAVVSEETGDIYMGADMDSNAEETFFRFVEPKVRLYTLRDGSRLGIGGAGDTTLTHTALDMALKVDMACEGPKDSSSEAVQAWMDLLAAQWTAQANTMEPKATDDNGALEATFLVGYHGRLYRMQQHECRELADTYAATGAGVHFAYGALYATDQYACAPVDRVMLACQAAIKFDKYCNGGVSVIVVPKVADGVA